MNENFKFLKSLDISDENCKLIIDKFLPDNLENYISANFKVSNSPVKSNWIPSFVLIKFIISRKPTYILTANQLGRELSKINIFSRNNHSPEAGQTCSGYYIQAVDNVLNYELIKFKRDYGNYIR